MNSFAVIATQSYLMERLDAEELDRDWSMAVNIFSPPSLSTSLLALLLSLDLMLSVFFYE